MVSPEPYPVTPSSVSTRTRVASKACRGTGSQAARSGGSSGSRIRSSRMAVIFTTVPARRMPSRLPLCAGSRLNGPKPITLERSKVRAEEGIGPPKGGHLGNVHTEAHRTGAGDPVAAQRSRVLCRPSAARQPWARDPGEPGRAKRGGRAEPPTRRGPAPHRAVLDLDHRGAARRLWYVHPVPRAGRALPQRGTCQL